MTVKIHVISQTYLLFIYYLVRCAGAFVHLSTLVRWNTMECICLICSEAKYFRKQLGGKLGSSIQSDLGVNTVGDLLQFSEEKLQECYGINTGSFSIIEQNSLDV